MVRLEQGVSSALMLDYDGTLAPFRPERDQAVPYPGVRERIERIIRTGRSRVVLITGRSVEDLVAVMGVEPTPEIWGSHGLERRFPDGRCVPIAMTERQGEGLDAAAHRLREMGLSEHMECKPGCVAAHWRSMTPEQHATVQKEVVGTMTKLARRFDLLAKEFDGGIEIRVGGRNKGDAVRTVLDEMGEGVAAAYLGDDTTDEDAFAAMNRYADNAPDAGLSVLVRPERRPTRAGLWLRPPDELLAFFDRWIQSTEG